MVHFEVVLFWCMSIVVLLYIYPLDLCYLSMLSHYSLVSRPTAKSGYLNQDIYFLITYSGCFRAFLNFQTKTLQFEVILSEILEMS